MAKTSNNEKILFTINENNRSQINSNRKGQRSQDLNEQNMLHRFERTRRNTLRDTSAVSTIGNASCQKHCYHQLAERVRELEKEIVPDRRFYQIPPVYSPFSAITPCSNVSGSSFSNYSRPQNFPINLLSPNSTVPTQRFGLSSKILEHAHQIPERFWTDWRQKQTQNRIEELEYIKNNLTSPNDIDLSTRSHRKSLSLFHDIHHRRSLPRSTTLDRIVSTSIDHETSPSNSDDHSPFSFDQRSIDDTESANLNDLNTPSPIEPMTPKSQSTLDRSRLTILLPFSNTNIPKQAVSTKNHCQSITKSTDARDSLGETISSTSSVEDIAQINTELNLTLLLRENQDQTNPLLYSKAIMNQTIEFRSSSSSKKDPLLYQNEISTDEEIVSNNRETDDRQSSFSSTDSFASARSTFSISVSVALNMADEQSWSKGHITPKYIPKKNIRIFVQRKRLLPGILHKYMPSQSNSLEQLSSIIEKNLNLNKKYSRNNKPIVVVNYKPVFVNSRKQKSTEPKITPTNDTSSTIPDSMTTASPVHSKTNHPLNPKSVSLDVPDVEDPFMFIEMMYQQLFTEDGQLRSETEPTVLANCVKQIVTQSRRNSMARRDSISPNIHHQKQSSTSFPSSPRFMLNPFNEEEGPHTLLQRNRTDNTSRGSSMRSSMGNADHHQQQLHAFLNSYYHNQKRQSINETTINPNYPFSVDDTDNEDLDTFSDLNSYRKIIRTSPPASIDEDITQTDSKLLSSSGYQSLKSSRPIISKIHTENDQYCCPNCIHTPQITVIPPTISTINIIQPIRDIFMKYLNFIFISKNILLVPLLIFLLRQRSMHISS